MNGTSVDLEEALARARDECALEDEEQRRRAPITAKVTYASFAIDPFVRQFRERGASPKHPRSDKQAGYVCYLSRQARTPWTFAAARNLSRRQASGVINRFKEALGI